MFAVASAVFLGVALVLDVTGAALRLSQMILEAS